ncbi:hypothetical protein F5Y16DRAFT_14087 [Xylariaceae sp. FL0255]|nr:hypothetical protein F5Y16DRAFT_14087 [Xylariaceae sp. FL0255]
MTEQMSHEQEESLHQRAHRSLMRLLPSQGELSAVERTMTDKLAQSLGQRQLLQPISLIDPATIIDLSKVPEGQHEALLEAIQKNVTLQKKLADQRAQLSAVGLEDSVPTRSSTSAKSSRAEAEKKLLEAQLEVNQLEKECSRLEVLQSYFKKLDRMPAASPGYLDPKHAFKDCVPFPQLARELVEGFTKQQSPDQEIQELVSRFRRANLRQKLVLQRDERRLEELKARTGQVDPNDAPLEVQVEALKAVKTSLVNWIETMLSKAGEGEAEEPDGDLSPTKPGSGTVKGEDFDYKTRLAQFEGEWQRHIQLRRQIEANMAEVQSLRASIMAAEEEPQQPRSQRLSTEPASPQREPQTYLLTPYLNKIAALSREQKGMIQEKGYINSMIARQQQETRDTLRRFAQESELLSKYPSPSQSEKSRSQEDGRLQLGGKRSTVESQVQPWLFAADSAKIATLESVAESVDAGQIAIDDAMQALDEVHRLQNKGELQLPGEVTSEPKEDEQWSEGHARKKSINVERKSIWSMLDGNLGLINE